MAAGPVRRPVSAFALSLASGILIVVGSLFLIFLSFGFLGIFGLLALVFGTIVLFAAILMYARPKEHAIWGVIVLVFACTSIVGLGGFVAGMILGIIGGSLGIAWQPEGPALGGYAQAAYAPYGGAPMTGPYGVPVTPFRMCMGCGRWIPWAYNVCPLCGTQTPVAAWVPRTSEAPYASPPVTIHPASAAPTYSSPAPTYVSPAPEYTAPSAPPVKAPCPTCMGEAEWNATASRWYCPAESKYF